MKVGLFCSEPLREAMAGIGIRYLQMAGFLHAQGHDLEILSTGTQREVPGFPVPLQPFGESDPTRVLSGCDAVIVQGAAVDSLLRQPAFSVPLVVDLYDPWMIENFSYYSTLGSTAYSHDYGSWILHLSRGDFFLCSCEEQRLFYLGFLAALGRVEPTEAQKDPDFRHLIEILPFSLPDRLPDYRKLLQDQQKRIEILFGCVYDWYDPFTLLEALSDLPEENWRLHLIRNPNPDTTPQVLLSRVETYCKEKNWWGDRVVLHDWFRFERRFDLLRDVDLMVAPHSIDLESRLCLRTRYLEALLVGCPVIVTEGGALSREISERKAGWSVPPGDPAALSGALRAVMEGGAEVESRVKAGKLLAANFQGRDPFQPLLKFLEKPRPSPTRQTPTKKGWLQRLVGRLN